MGIDLRGLWPAIDDDKTHKIARLVVATTLCGILLVWAISIFLILDKRQALLEERRQVLERVGSAVSAQVQQYFKVIEVFLNSANQWCAKNPASDPRFDEDFSRLLASFQASIHHQIDIRLFDEHGGVFFPPAKSDQPLANMAHLEMFVAANAGQKTGVFIGEPFLGMLNKRWLIPVSLPLEAKPHGLALIAAVIPLQTLEGVFEAARDQPNGSVALLRRDGTVMARMPRVEDMVGKSIGAGRLISAVIKEKPHGTVVKSSDIDGKERLLAYDTSLDFPLVTVVTADIEDILLPSYRYSAYALVVTLAISLFMIATAILALKHLKLVAETNRKLSAEAATDSLTGVHNRRSLLHRASNELMRGRRYGRPLSLLMMDLDHFKEINDNYGHQWGDEVLKQVVVMAQSALRVTDMLGRYGGEEFAVLMPETSTEEAASVAERIRERISQIMIDTGNDRIGIRVSIGVATLNAEEADIQSLINRADAALYSAKRSGRNRVVTQ